MGAPLGAHLFNAGRGSLLADLGVSAGWIAAGVLFGSATEAETEIYVIATFGQVIGVAATEVRTSRRIEPTVGARVTPTGSTMEIGFRIR